MRVSPPGMSDKKIIRQVVMICVRQNSESGSGARPLEATWVTEIRDQCLRARVPFFFKQWGGVHLCLRHWRRQKKRAGRTLEGRTWDEMPASMSFART